MPPVKRHPFFVLSTPITNTFFTKQELQVTHLTALNLDTWALTEAPNREPAYAIGKR